ncbi:hypothetical protein [Tunicatimonas pelagia]|uniref:hypothetical protein n=1 Tax=Tunicatimonas pelagia TaxID=931531 RepID=UPI0026666D78|nr:hypothetical protein [Tunicatimonas pelagia]WKN43255.1 hypothetical protein P0M28_29875 [Tunicatimonas pelagia]
MGFLPIILAIVGFLFLWGIVNYHSLKTRKKEVEEAAELVFRYAALRQNIIIQLSNIEGNDDSLSTLLHRIVQSFHPIDKNTTTATEIVASGQQLSQQVDELPDQLGKHKVYRSSIEQLQKADLAYRIAANRYSLKLEQYLGLVTKPPSKFVAALFGFSRNDIQLPEEEVVTS